MSKDTIYRQAAIDALNAYEDVVDTASQVFTIRGCKKAITNLPSAQLDPSEALRILDAINSSGRLDYGDYCDLHDAILEIGLAQNG